MTFVTQQKQCEEGSLQHLTFFTSGNKNNLKQSNPAPERTTKKNKDQSQQKEIIKIKEEINEVD